MKQLWWLGLLLLAMNNVGAQQKKDTPNKLNDVRNQFNKVKDSIAGQADNKTLVSQATQLANEQFITILAGEKQKQAEYQDEAFKMQHRWRSYSFQYYASIIIFILVIGIVITGIIFSGIQFRYTLRQLKISEKVIDAVKTLPTAAGALPSSGGTTTAAAEVITAPVATTPAAAETTKAIPDFKSELELSTTGLKVNSSVLGVIILALSIAFLYLYLIYVYPIKINPAAPAFNVTATDSSKTKKD